MPVLVNKQEIYGEVVKLKERGYKVTVTQPQQDLLIIQIDKSTDLNGFSLCIVRGETDPENFYAVQGSSFLSRSEFQTFKDGLPKDIVPILTGVIEKECPLMIEPLSMYPESACSGFKP